MGSDSSVSGTRLEHLESALRDQLPMLLAELGRALEPGWPDYAKIIQINEPEVCEAAQVFVHRLVVMTERALGDQEPATMDPDPTMQTVLEQVGRVQWMNGRELPELLAAYQVGARVTWHNISQIALHAGVDVGILTQLAESMFVMVNQLSAASAGGYVSEQTEATMARDQLREELGRLLLSDRSQAAEIRLAARRVGWMLPERAAIIVVDPGDEAAKAIIDGLGGRSLPIHNSPELYGAICPVDDHGRFRRRIARAVRGAHAVIGSVVTLDQLPETLASVRTVLSLRRRGLLDEDPLFVSDHFDTLLIHRDERLYELLRSQVLAPLDRLPEPVRARLVETLTAWLRHMGNRAAIAEELHVHPQTVRYRLGQLRELFGDALDDPDVRARLFLALIWAS